MPGPYDYVFNDDWQEYCLSPSDFNTLTNVSQTRPAKQKPVEQNQLETSEQNQMMSPNQNQMMPSHQSEMQQSNQDQMQDPNQYFGQYYQNYAIPGAMPPQMSYYNMGSNYPMPSNGGYQQSYQQQQQYSQQMPPQPSTPMGQFVNGNMFNTPMTPPAMYQSHNGPVQSYNGYNNGYSGWYQQ